MEHEAEAGVLQGLLRLRISDYVGGSALHYDPFWKSHFGIYMKKYRIPQNQVHSLEKPPLEVTGEVRPTWGPLSLGFGIPIGV